MSLVTSACLYVQFAMPDVEKRLLEPLPFDGREQAFRKVPWDVPGGNKGMHGDVYLGGFNYVLPEDLVSHLRDVLGDTEAVLIVEMEDDFGPEVHRFPIRQTANGPKFAGHPYIR